MLCPPLEPVHYGQAEAMAGYTFRVNNSNSLSFQRVKAFKQVGRRLAQVSFGGK